MIGVQDTPKTWSIPFGTSFIDPNGPARWSSAFGEKEVLDFRVQISTSKNFDATRAHWYVTPIFLPVVVFVIGFLAS